MTDTTITGQSRQVLKRWVLPISLLCNLFALGIAVSPFAPLLHTQHKNHHAISIDQLTEGLPAEDASVLRKVYDQEEPALDQSHEVLRSSMRKISTILAAPTPDQAELQQTLDNIASAQSKIREATAELVKHASTDLSPEARQILSQRGWQGNVRR